MSMLVMNPPGEALASRNYTNPSMALSQRTRYGFALQRSKAIRSFRTAMPFLTLHPDARCDAVTAIEVDVARAPRGMLRLLYTVSGRIADIALPAPAPAARVDGLWQHTCFEAFVRPPSGSAYFELNFAPSLSWACYRFDDYRQGMTVPGSVPEPRMKSVSNAVSSFALDVVLALDSLNLPDNGPWRLGLAVIIEEKSGNISWWALTHPQGKPDFHSAAGFVLELPPERS
jgi:hypothetical protein